MEASTCAASLAAGPTSTSTSNTTTTTISTTSTSTTTPTDVERFMRAALAQAEDALGVYEVPVGCVFVHNGEIVSSGFNLTNKLKNGTMHAEICSINKIIKEKKYPVSILKECDLYVTCEPCIMCAAALSRVGIRHVYFGCHNDRFGGNGSVLDIHSNAVFGTPHLYGATSGVMKAEAIDMFRRFYAQENSAAPEAKRRKKDGGGKQD
jgi:tRNA-specific adenosine deaminase 2